MNEHITPQPDETVILKIRKHWWLLFAQLLPTIIVGIVPFIFLIASPQMGQLPPWATPALLTYASVWWLIVIWCTIATQWTIYYLNVWIVTNRRILNAEQRGLFDRQTTTWLLDRVQEITVHVDDMIGTVFGFGTLEVQTAGPTDEYATIRGVRDPEGIQKTIMEEVEQFTESRGPGTVAASAPKADQHQSL